MKAENNKNQFFSETERQAIQSCIAQAEKMSSGEIRVRVDKRCKGDVLDKAVKTFYALKMDKTALRNGVLIYLSTTDRKTAIIGDKGINDLMVEGYWDATLEGMREAFSEEKYLEGLQTAILSIGEKLKQHFPFQSGDENELNNEISYGD